MNPGNGQSQNGKNSKTEALPQELTQLGNRLQQLNIAERDELLALFNNVQNSVRRRNRVLAMVQEALSQLRLDVKYLMFDLEVTRKERDELQQQLDQQRFDL